MQQTSERSIIFTADEVKKALIEYADNQKIKIPAFALINAGPSANITLSWKETPKS